MDEDKKEIVVRAFGMFMKYGIRSVTMDDLARELRASKKTLYKHFSDKDELVAACMDYHNEHEKMAIEKAICQPNQNAIDENFELSKVIIQQLQQIHPSVLYDLEKYYPEALQEFESYKQTQVAEWVTNNMKKGIEEGLYRDDLNIPILTALYLKRMNDFFSMDAFPEGTTMETVYREIFRYHIRGLASEKGIAYLKEKMKQELN
jgi:AcrR family transcriptional regulator